MNFRVLVSKRVWKIKFLGLKSGQDLKNRAAHPHRELTGVPPGGITCFFLTLFVGRGQLKRGRESIYSFNKAPSV